MVKAEGPIVSILVNCWKKLGFFLRRFFPFRRVLEFDEDLVMSLHRLAEGEKRDAEELAGELLESALIEYYLSTEMLGRWGALTQREQEVTALVCMGYSNPQIADVLGVSHNTARSHVTSILRKFGLNSHQELRMLLDGWDFSQWG